MTLIADIIKPTPFADYMMDSLADKNALFTSGIMFNDPLLAQMLTGGSDRFQVPFWGGITDTESIVPIENTAAAVGKIGTYKLSVVRQLRVMNWGTSALATIMAGANPASALQIQVNEYWQSEMQNILVSTIKGVTASADGNKISLDVAPATGEPSASTIIGANHIIDVQTLLGDNGKGFGAMIVHSQVMADLRKQNLITVLQDKDTLDPIEFYGKMRVIEDDRVPTIARTYTVAGVVNVYGTVLVKKGSFAFAETQANYKAVHIEKNEALGMGQEILMTKREFCLHPSGWNYKGTPAGLAPTNAELATGASWEIKNDPKLTGFVVLFTN